MLRSDVSQWLTSAEDLVMTSAHALASKIRHKSMTESQDASFF